MASAMVNGRSTHIPAAWAMVPASQGSRAPPTIDAAFSTPMAVGTRRARVSRGTIAMVVGKMGPRAKPSSPSAAQATAAGDSQASAAAAVITGQAGIHHAGRGQAGPGGDRADQEPAEGQPQPEPADRVAGQRPAQGRGLHQVAEAPVAHAEFQADVEGQHRRAELDTRVAQRGDQQAARAEPEPEPEPSGRPEPGSSRSRTGILAGRRQPAGPG